MINLCHLTQRIISYPQNGDRIVTIDSETSLHAMYMGQKIHQLYGDLDPLREEHPERNRFQAVHSHVLGTRHNLGKEATNSMQQGRLAITMRPVIKSL